MFFVFLPEEVELENSQLHFLKLTYAKLIRLHKLQVELLLTNKLPMISIIQSRIDKNPLAELEEDIKIQKT